MSQKEDLEEVQKAAGFGSVPKGLPRDESVEAVRTHIEVARLQSGQNASETSTNDAGKYDAVNPPHYRRGPIIKVDIGENITKGISTFERVVHCIEVMRHIKDPRLATAFKYIWRVAFGGKKEPGDPRPQAEIDRRDIESAIWYLQDWVDHPV